MNARLVKEARNLLPILVLTWLGILLPRMIPGGQYEALTLVAFGLGCAIMAGSLFGHEFHHRTMTTLLSQPLPRPVIWREKMLVLALAIGVCGLILLLALWHEVELDRGSLPHLGWFVAGCSLSALCAFCGGSCLTLLSRNGIAGTVFSITAPSGLVLGYSSLVYWMSPKLEYSQPDPYTVSTLLLIYCGVTGYGGYIQFQRMQVLDATAHDLKMPAGLDSLQSETGARLTSRLSPPVASLLRKELRMQQPCFLVAGVFCIIAVMAVSLIKPYPETIFVTLTVCFGIFMVATPLLAGTIAVAEERGWQLADWHLTLPPSTAKQWSIKMLATFATSMGLGLLLPGGMLLVGYLVLTFERSDSALDAMHKVIQSAEFQRAVEPTEILGGIELVVVIALTQILFTTIGIFAGSVSNSTMRALQVALGMIFGALFCPWLGYEIAERVRWVLTAIEEGFTILEALANMAAGTRGPNFAVIPPSGELLAGLPRWEWQLLFWVAALLIMLCMAQYFAFRNYRERGTPARRIALQALVILALLLAFNTGVYCI